MSLSKLIKVESQIVMLNIQSGVSKEKKVRIELQSHILFQEPYNSDINGDLSTLDLSLWPLKESRTLFQISSTVDLQPGKTLTIAHKSCVT